MPANRRRIWWLLPLILWPSGCARTPTRLQVPGATLGAVAPVAQSPDGVELSFDVIVKNPYQQPIALFESAYAVTSEGQTLARARADLRVKTVPPRLAPGKSQSVPIVIRLTTQQILQALGGPRGGDTIDYTADLFVTVDAPAAGQVTLSTRATGLLPVPPAMLAEFPGVLFDPAGQPCDGWVGLRLTNRNSFPVELLSVSAQATYDGRINATGSLAKSVRLEPGGTVEEYDLPVTITPALAPADKPRPGTSIPYLFRGSALLRTPRGDLQVPINAQGQTIVAE